MYSQTAIYCLVLGVLVLLRLLHLARLIYLLQLLNLIRLRLFLQLLPHRTLTAKVNRLDRRQSYDRVILLEPIPRQYLRNISRKSKESGHPTIDPSSGVYSMSMANKIQAGFFTIIIVLVSQRN
jgi:hypothetical protein